MLPLQRDGDVSQAYPPTFCRSESTAVDVWDHQHTKAHSPKTSPKAFSTSSLALEQLCKTGFSPVLNQFEQAALSSSIDTANLLSHQYLSLQNTAELAVMEAPSIWNPKGRHQFWINALRISINY